MEKGVRIASDILIFAHCSQAYWQAYVQRFVICFKCSLLDPRQERETYQKVPIDTKKI
jgi:hypothetical protein